MPKRDPPLPIYDGLLQLATNAERACLLAGGHRKLLDHNRVFEPDPAASAAEAAYKAINDILQRLSGNPSMQITGIDSRMMPPARTTVPVETVRTGRLMWEGPEGIRSCLILDWCNPTVHIIDLQIEPTNQQATAPLTTMSGPTHLAPGERMDDNERLLLMQKYISENNLLPKSAARRVAIEMPSPPTGEESLVTRLVRKFNKLKKD
jgi:hypothetical protein